MSLSDQILQFLSSLELSPRLPKGVVVMNPYLDPNAFKLCRLFYSKYYSDNHPRVMILGINPGRFGGGATGIPFTDPKKLEVDCGIPNGMPKKAELSADFIYKMIYAYGGPELFYRHFYISSLSPLGFTKNDKNLNYYDQPDLEKLTNPFIVKSLTTQLEFGFRTDVCFCLGEGQNFKYLSRLNLQQRFFSAIVPLAHPRFIMQYRRKKIDDYIAIYLSFMRKVAG